jgi:hypothetical protein
MPRIDFVLPNERKYSFLFDQFGETAEEVALRPLLKPSSAKRSGDQVDQNDLIPTFDFDATRILIGKDEEEQVGFMRPQPSDYQAPRVPLLTGGKQLPIPLGLTVLVGGKGSGKTTLCEYSALYLTERGANDIGYYGFGEPVLATPFGDPTEFGSARFALRLAEFLASTAENILFLDGLRPFIYTGKGATGKQGVAMGIFNFLTELGYLVEARGKRLIVSINPLTTNQEILDVYEEAAGGSAQTTLISRGEPGTFSFTTRDPQFGSRDARTVRLDLKRCIDYIRANEQLRTPIVETVDDLSAPAVDMIQTTFERPITYPLTLKGEN